MKYFVLVTMMVIGLFFSSCASTSNGHVISKKSIEKVQPKKIKLNWILDQNGCKRWNPNPVPNETITWTGTCKDGKVDGVGTFIWYEDGRAGSKYVGEYKKGKKHGEGTLYYKNGDKYIGEYKEDKRHGKGTAIESRGSYVGEFKKGKKHGKGTLSYATGEKYIGDFKKGNADGKGTLLYKNGTKYIGEWKNTMKDGKGVFYYYDGTIFTGEFKRNKRHGKGITYFKKSGNKLVVRYINGKKEGKGIRYYANGDKFQKKGKRRSSSSRNAESTGILNGGIIGAGLALWAGAAIKQAFTGRSSDYDSKSSSSSKNSNNNSNKEHSSSSSKKDRVTSNGSCSYKVNRTKNTDTPRKSKGKQIKCSNGEYITVAKYYKQGKWKKESDIVGARWFNTFDDVAEHVCGCD